MLEDPSPGPAQEALCTGAGGGGARGPSDSEDSAQHLSTAWQDSGLGACPARSPNAGLTAGSVGSELH